MNEVSFSSFNQPNMALAIIKFVRREFGILNHSDNINEFWEDLYKLKQLDFTREFKILKKLFTPLVEKKSVEMKTDPAKEISPRAISIVPEIAEDFRPQIPKVVSNILTSKNLPCIKKEGWNGKSKNNSVIVTKEEIDRDSIIEKTKKILEKLKCSALPSSYLTPDRKRGQYK